MSGAATGQARRLAVRADARTSRRYSALASATRRAHRPRGPAVGTPALGFRTVGAAAGQARRATSRAGASPTGSHGARRTGSAHGRRRNAVRAALGMARHLGAAACGSLAATARPLARHTRATTGTAVRTGTGPHGRSRCTAGTGSHSTRRLPGTTAGAGSHSTRGLTRLTTASRRQSAHRLPGARAHGARRLTRLTTTPWRQSARRMARTAAGPRPYSAGRLTRTGHCGARPRGAGAVRPDSAVPAGVFLAVRTEGSRGTARSVGPAATPARTRLLGHDSARHATVLTGLRSTLATGRTLDHPGSALRHRTGTAGDHGCTCALPPRDHRRYHGGGSYRPAVTRTDTAWTGYVRSPGEPTGLRLVRVGTLVHVPLAAGLTPAPALSGPPVSAGSAVAVGPVVLAGTRRVTVSARAVCAAVTARLHQSVRAGVGTGLNESVCAGVRAGLDEGMRARTRPHRAVGCPVPARPGRSRVAGTTPGFAVGGAVTGLPTAAGVPAGRFLGGGTVLGPPSPAAATAGPVVAATRLSRATGSTIGAGATPALLVAVRDGAGLMHGVIPGRDRAGLVHGLAPSRNRTRLVDGVVAGRDRTRLVDGVVAGRDRTRLMRCVIPRGNRTRLMHGVVTGRDRTRLVHTARPARRDRVRRTETGPCRRAGRHRTNTGTGGMRTRRHGPDAGHGTAGTGRRGAGAGDLGRVAGRRDDRTASRRLTRVHLSGGIRVHLTAAATHLGATTASTGRCLTGHRTRRHLTGPRLPMRHLTGGNTRRHLARSTTRRHLTGNSTRRHLAGPGLTGHARARRHLTW
ncbi:hypothetical protein [Actinoplanes italicus]|uniref:Uncharacterized protein n=1 Tax=Actinoplanes italicus TaxID=113567 RepID=A0A2T0K4Z1_9ACTN|nr:hypothetical protein [Actinoplanes italicus]PRX17962.1 hypothetical protein CLV67_114133 [Actinoplanes italicus]